MPTKLQKNNVSLECTSEYQMEYFNFPSLSQLCNLARPDVQIGLIHPPKSPTCSELGVPFFLKKLIDPTAPLIPFTTYY